MGVLIRAIISCIPLITISTGKICTELLNYISDTVNISYSLIDAVCFIASNPDDDSSGDNSGDIPYALGYKPSAMALTLHGIYAHLGVGL